jgi:glycolate oxidase FAD binding subunit
MIAITGKMMNSSNEVGQEISKIYPSTPKELSTVLSAVYCNSTTQTRQTVLPCGNGSKLHWGGFAETDLILSTAKLNQLIDHAVGDLTVTAEAGMTLATLQAELAKAGQFLPIDPSYADTATLGGIVATADTGAWRQRYGGVRDLLIGITFARSDGAIAKAGGRVVKNVAGYDLMKLFTGSHGTLGVITQVTFRIYPLPAASQTVMITGDANGIAKATQTLLASALTPTAIALTAPHTLDEGIALLARFQNIEISVATQAAQFLKVGEALGLQGKAIGDDTTLWQQLQQQIERSTPTPPIACKIGVLPSGAVAALSHMNAVTPITGCIYGSGLGTIRLGEGSAQTVAQLRQICQNQGGFLTVLEAPIALKQQIDIWGYSGNALDLMKKIKHEFDPTHILSPNRFVV